MSTPCRLSCESQEDIPSAAHIRKLVSPDQHLVMELPTSYDKGYLIQQLAAQLPEYSVFDSGNHPDTQSVVRQWVTVKAVVSEEVVLENAATLLAAARLFRSTANELMARLAQHFSQPQENLYDRWFRFREDVPEHILQGHLDEEWEYIFHGFECAFSNQRTQQVVEVILGFPGEWGVLDPYFFALFVEMTPGLESLAQLFHDAYHDPCRALEVLERHGYLHRIKARDAGGNLFSGLTVAGQAP